METEAIAQTIKDWREKTGTSREVLAKQLGVSSMTIYRWEHLKSSVGLKSLKTLIALNILPSEGYFKSPVFNSCRRFELAEPQA